MRIKDKVFEIRGIGGSNLSPEGIIGMKNAASLARLAHPFRGAGKAKQHKVKDALPNCKLEAALFFTF